MVNKDPKESQMRQQQPARPSEQEMAADPVLNPEARDAIASNLRRLYGGMLDAPMPDKFSQLLADLAGSEKKS